MSIIKEDWEYCEENKTEIEKSYTEFETNINNLIKNIDDGLKTRTFLYNHNGSDNQDCELRTLMENNKELRSQKDKKLEETSSRMAQYECLKKEQKTLKQEIKKTHEAFLMAKKYYKKFLKMYYTVESRNDKDQSVFVQFFTEAKKDSNNFSIFLIRNTDTGHYQLKSTTPTLPYMENLQRKLQKSNDVPGALCYIRQAFMEINTKKN